MDITNFYTYGPGSGEKAQSMVILLHGVGSNGRDLHGLSPLFAQSLPNTVFLSPDAPFACDMVPPGYPDSYQWFSLQDRDPQAMLAGAQSVFPIIEAFIETQLETYGLSPDKLALVGFSQGTMTSLYTAPRLKETIAGVLGYSGALLWDNPASFRTCPIHLIHGQQDDVVPVAAWDHAVETLREQGFSVSGHTTPGLMHSIDQDGIDSGITFLKRVLG